MFNSVQFSGNMVRDGEFADTKDTDILNFAIASSRKYKDKEDVTFLDCTAFGNTAVAIAKFFSKGSPIGVEGRLSQNNWEDREGNKRTKIYITVDAFHFVGPTDRQDRGGGGQQRGSQQRGSQRGNNQGNRGRSGGRGGSGRGHQQDQSRNEQNQGQREGSQGGGGSNDYENEIPF